MKLEERCRYISVIVKDKVFVTTCRLYPVLLITIIVIDIIMRAVLSGCMHVGAL